MTYLLDLYIFLKQVNFVNCKTCIVNFSAEGKIFGDLGHLSSLRWFEFYVAIDNLELAASAL